MSSASTIPDYYAALGVAPSATSQEIEQAYRDHVWIYHPDRMAGMRESARLVAEAKLKIINQARETLSDPAQRAIYDQDRLTREGETPRTAHSQERAGGVGTAGQGWGDPEPAPTPSGDSYEYQRQRPSWADYQGQNNGKNSAFSNKMDMGDDTERDRSVTGRHPRPAPVYTTVYTAHPEQYPFRSDVPAEPKLDSVLAGVIVVLFLLSNMLGQAANFIYTAAASLHTPITESAEKGELTSPQPSITTVTPR